MNQELLQTISNLVDQKSEPVYERFDSMDDRLDGTDVRLDSMDARFHNLHFYSMVLIGCIIYEELHILFPKGWCSMKNENRDNTVSNSRNLHDDGSIPPKDIPQEVIPDEVPRKDGPGGE